MGPLVRERSAPGAEDRGLVRRVLAGELEARERLTERLACVRHFLLARNHRSSRPLPREDLEEVAQEARFFVWKGLRHFRGDARLETWIHAITMRLFVRHAQRRNRRITLECALEASSMESRADPGPPSPRSLESYLRLLTEQQGRVLWLRFGWGLGWRDIAVELGITVPTAKKHYQRGLESLRRFVPPPEAGESADEGGPR